MNRKKINMNHQNCEKCIWGAGGFTNCDKCDGFIKFKPMKFNPGEKVKTKCYVTHGDWKTLAVFPDRWPIIPEETEVEFIKEWVNCYGNQATIKGPNGSIYDVSPNKLEKILI